MTSKYERFFVDADTDADGYLTLAELTNMLRKNGYKETDDKIKTMFCAVDVSGDNKISRDEYLRAMGEIPQQDHQEGAMRSCFRMFDRDGSGFIDRAELAEALKNNGTDMSSEDVQRVLELVDRDRSGTIDYEEFIAYLFGK